jgi:hypothetical protein
VRRSASISCFSVVFTEHYRKLAAEYFSLGYYCRYTMLHTQEHKSKRGVYLDGHWEMQKTRFARSGAFLSAPLAFYRFSRKIL